MDKTENQSINNSDMKEIQVKPVKEEKGRKKDDKSIEQVLKALNSLEKPEEKLAALCKKYTEIAEDNRKLQSVVKLNDKKSCLVQREKEQLQLECNKAILTKSKLESLCRELQRQNKAIKDESLLRVREEEERRKETQAKFQTTLTEITVLMQQNNEKNNKLRDDNIEMSKKFKSIVEQYELREQQVDRMSKQMELEGQLAEAKLAKVKTEALAEREIGMREKQGLLLEIKKYQAQLKEQETLEIALREQISMYTNKYDEFQNSLVKSNQVFGGFKAEMEKMSKKILKLEKETTSWKQRWEKSQTALLNMATDKQKQDAELALGNRQLQQLQKLCRTMQNERTALLATLKASGIERPTIPDVEPEAAIADLQTTAKYDKMAINCMELKNNLAELQGQLSALTMAKETSSAATCTSEKKAPAGKNKKSKNKNNKENNVNKVETVPEIDNKTVEGKKNDTGVGAELIVEDTTIYKLDDECNRQVMGLEKGDNIIDTKTIEDETPKINAVLEENDNIAKDVEIIGKEATIEVVEKLVQSDPLEQIETQENVIKADPNQEQEQLLVKEGSQSLTAKQEIVTSIQQ